MPVVRLSRPTSVLLRLAIACTLVTAWLPALNAQQQPHTVWAAGYNVTSLADPGTGICDETECTLREAILAANSSAGSDWIKIVPNGILTLTSALPAITDDLTIDATDRMFNLDGSGAFRVLSSTAPLSLTNLTIQNGLAPDGDGGGAYFGAEAILTDVTFRANATAALSSGGGAYFAGPASVFGGQFVGNGAGDTGGGAYFQSTAMVSHTTFVDNSAPAGAGGGAFFEQPAWITTTSFVDNVGGSAGGAHFGAASLLTGVSFVDNQSLLGDGGGAVLGGIGSVVADSLFEGNSAQTYGGGLALAALGTGASVTLTANRIWHNSAESGGGGLFLHADVSGSLDNNVIAANSVSAADAGSEVSMAGANAHLIGRHNTLASITPGSGVALRAGTGAIGETVALTNTIFDGYAVGVKAGPFSPNVTLDGVLWSSVTTTTQGAGITVNSATTGSAAFTNSILRNYHLTSASDAIDQGLDSELNVDFEDDPRSSGSAPDLGADEFIALAPAPPNANDDTTSLPEDSSITVHVLANDSDANNDTLTISALGPPTSGAATLRGTVAVVYTPTLNFAGTDVFTYSVTDATFTSTAQVTITVTPVNDDPTISAVSGITLTAGTGTGALPFHVDDVESGGAVTVTAQSDNQSLVPDANISLGGSGVSRTVTVVSAGGRAGSATITLTVSDEQAATAQTSFVVTVVPRMFLPLVRN